MIGAYLNLSHFAIQTLTAGPDAVAAGITAGILPITAGIVKDGSAPATAAVFWAEQTGSGTTFAQGVAGVARSTHDTGTLDVLQAIAASCYVLGDGDVTDVRPFHAGGGTHLGSGTVGGWPLILLTQPGGTGAITEMIGVEVSHLTRGTTNVAMRSYGGKVEIGDHLESQGLLQPYDVVTVDTNFGPNDYTIGADCTAGPIVLTLPAAGPNLHRIYVAGKEDSGPDAVTLQGTVNGVVNPTISTQYEFWTLHSNGTEWRRIAKSV